MGQGGQVLRCQAGVKGGLSTAFPPWTERTDAQPPQMPSKPPAASFHQESAKVSQSNLRTSRLKEAENADGLFCYRNRVARNVSCAYGTRGVAVAQSLSARTDWRSDTVNGLLTSRFEGGSRGPSQSTEVDVTNKS